MLWLERKQSPDVSWALWLPSIWILYIASKPLGVWFRPAGSLEDVELGSPLDRRFIIFLFCLALLILLKRRFKWTVAFRENAWLILLLLYMLVSVSWSSSPDLSFRRWSRDVPAVIMAFMVLSESSPRQAMESLFRRSAYVLIPFSWVLIKYFPIYGVAHGRWGGAKTWVGVALQKNGLGRLCLVVVFFLTWSVLRRWRDKKIPIWKLENLAELFLLGLSLLLLRGPGGSSYSATSIVALGMGLLSYYGLRYYFKSRGAVSAKIPMIAVSTIIVFGIISVFMGKLPIGSLVASTGRDATLTGRATIWAWLLPIALKNPVLGKGYGSFWTTSTIGVLGIRSAHNGYLDLMLGLGFVGILVVWLFLLSSLRKICSGNGDDVDWIALSLSFVIMAMIHNISESSISLLSSHLTALIIFFSVTSFRGAANRVGAGNEAIPAG